MLLIIDNYDSFTYNLVQYFQQLGQNTQVYTNDAITIAEIKNLNPKYIVISPGPNSPSDAGISRQIIRDFYQHIPILGICLGHQAIAEEFGATIHKAPQIVHGKTSAITHNGLRIFANIPNNFHATRYHSLAIDCTTLSQKFSIDAWADDIIMAISHRHHPLFGIQFHPESILTENGIKILENFINYEYHQLN